MGATRVGAPGSESEQDGKCATSHCRRSFDPDPDGPSMLTRSATERIALATLTWLGHASFRLDTDDGKRIYIDPFLSGPTCPDSEKEPDRGDAIAVTHGHGDHSADVVALQQRLGCPVVGMIELISWLNGQGVADDKLVGFNKGGTIEVAGVRVTMTHAFHSSSAPDGTYTGEPAG